MAAIGTLVNWSALAVCISKCGHIFAGVCVYIWGVSTWTLHACYHVARRPELVTKARGTGTGLAGPEVSCLWLDRSCSLSQSSPLTSQTRAGTFKSASPS